MNIHEIRKAIALQYIVPGCPELLASDGGSLVLKPTPGERVSATCQRGLDRTFAGCPSSCRMNKPDGTFDISLARLAEINRGL